MRCYKCGKMVKGSGAEYIPSYRLTILNIHMHEECKGRTLHLEAFWTFLTVREQAGFNNNPYFEKIVDFLILELRS